MLWKSEREGDAQACATPKGFVTPGQLADGD
jgi:hypothetical protein